MTQDERWDKRYQEVVDFLKKIVETLQNTI